MAFHFKNSFCLVSESVSRRYRVGIAQPIFGSAWTSACCTCALAAHKQYGTCCACTVVCFRLHLSACVPVAIPVLWLSGLRSRSAPRSGHAHEAIGVMRRSAPDCGHTVFGIPDIEQPRFSRSDNYRNCYVPLCFQIKTISGNGGRDIPVIQTNLRHTAGTAYVVTRNGPW